MQLPTPARALGVDHAADWEGSGLAALTGPADGEPITIDNPVVASVAALADGVSTAATRLGGAAPKLDAASSLTERARLDGLTRRGVVSCGGGCAMYEAVDGWLALSLARGSDRELLPAWLGASTAVVDDDGELRHELRRHRVGDLVGLAAELGIPVASVGEEPGVAPARRALTGSDRAVRPVSDIRVVDLSAMWAGPLVGRLLAAAGAAVTKVESPHRPDALANGSPELFRRLNGAKRRVSIDLRSPRAVVDLRTELLEADLVIDSSRPRAMAQLGIDVVGIVASGTTWLSITGHGRASNRVAFGDDAAVAGGAWVVPTGARTPVFVGDALADPVAGWVGAWAAFEALEESRSTLIDVSMSASVWHVLGRRRARQ
ncbi:MAG: CoA transferase [Acidimicrobiia bacterium]|nr:CoA transferase [Acidimicrobiia bacterium]